MSNNMTFTDPALYNVVAAPPPAAASFHHAAAVPPAPFYNVPAAPPPAAPFHNYAGVPMPPAAPFHNYAAVPMPPAAPFQNYAPLSHAALFVPSPPPVPIDVPVRKVWARNFTAEMDALDAFATRASHVAVNVQYPGVLHEDPGSSATAEKRYAVLKANVDALKPLQLGLAVLRDDGQCKAWEFHLAGFDRESDPYSADSVEYLQARGMRLDALRVGGVPVSLLSMRLHHCGLLRRPGLAWVTYDGAYHVAHLLKAINASQPLPGDIAGFHALVGRFLQGDAYDVARMAAVHPNLPVGLEQIADALGLPKPMVSPRLAGARVVLALQVFLCLGPSFYPGFAPVI
jgi:CCR4-NOT transcription complex subunit 7/8